ncbi:MAG: extracellular solute-binding protein [Armatimonadetes bacterium]|nr:extracellular solute-binding protein [Armatimonadota bacterium]
MKMWGCLFVILLAALSASAQEEAAPASEAAGADASAQPVTIEVGTLGAPEEASAWLEREAKLFMGAHPGIAVSMMALSSDRLREPIESLPGLAKNVVGIDSEPGYETSYLVERDLLVPIDSFLPDEEFDVDWFYDSYWDAATYRGRKWGVPWAVQTPLLVCNWPLFEAAGIEHAPETWDEFMGCAERLTKDLDGDGTPDQWGVRISTRGSLLGYLVASIMLQKGGHYFRNGQFDIQTQELVDTLDFVAYLMIRSGLANIDRRPLSRIAVESPNAYGMDFLTTDSLPQILGKPQYRLAPLPVPEGGVRVTACPKRLYLAICRSSPEEERASWEFVKWMSRRDISLPAAFAGFPCRKDLVDREDFKRLGERGPRNLEAAVTASQYSVDVGEQIYHRYEGLSALYNPLEDVFIALAGGNAQLDVAEAILKAQVAANEVIGPPLLPKRTQYQLYTE